MKKNYLFVVLAVGLVGLQTLKADTGTSTQALTMTVGGSSLIKVVDATGAVPATIALSLGGPADAGASVDSVSSNNLTRLRMTNYTTSGAKNKIQASVAADAGWVGSNTRLQVALDPPVNQTNFRNYATNASTGISTLQTLADNTGVKAALPLVTNLTTAWSGLAPGDGYVIRYVYSKVSQSVDAQPVAGTTVTFTIVAN